MALNRPHALINTHQPLVALVNLRPVNCSRPSERALILQAITPSVEEGLATRDYELAMVAIKLRAIQIFAVIQAYIYWG